MRQKTEKALIAEYLLSLQPPSLRERLHKTGTFGERFGLRAESVFRFGDRVSISGTEFFAAARRALTSGEAEQLVSREGGQITVSKLDGSIYIQIAQAAGEPQRILFKELCLLSTEREERVLALGQCLSDIGPTRPDLWALSQAVTERELSEREVAELLDAQWNGVAGLQARLHTCLEGGKATIPDLVPDCLDYFERFCGPAPGNLAPEEYLGSILPEYRKELLRLDLRWGLEICLIGALRDDLCPGAWLEEVNDDELWEALQACQPQLEPFSLLGALDIALHRQHDERFRTFAEESVAKLLDIQFSDSYGVDLYQILPALAQFVENCINLMEDGVIRAPFWKRMCAWMQANLVVRLASPLAVDFDRLRTRLDSELILAGRYAKLLDLRREPMYLAGELAPTTLRGEIVGRLFGLQLRHETAGRTAPGADRIKDAVARGADTGPPLAWAFPGPLEGLRRPEEAERTLDEESRDKLLQLSGDVLLANMVNLSQLFHFDDRTRSALREMISTTTREDDALNPVERLSRLAKAGIVAAAERDQGLAETIAASILALTPHLQDETTVVLGLQTLLIVGAAFEEEATWVEWMKEQLSRYAFCLPAGKASSSLYAHIQELKKVLKLDLDVYSQAEAVASAGAF